MILNKRMILPYYKLPQHYADMHPQLTCHTNIIRMIMLKWSRCVGTPLDTTDSRLRSQLHIYYHLKVIIKVFHKRTIYEMILIRNHITPTNNTHISHVNSLNDFSLSHYLQTLFEFIIFSMSLKNIRNQYLICG